MRKFAILAAVLLSLCAGCLNGNGAGGAGQPTFTSVCPNTQCSFSNSPTP